MSNSKQLDDPRVDALPESIIQLYIEVQKHHPHLFKKYPELGQLWGTPESLGILAAEVNIVVDGMFDDKGVDALAELTRSRLVARRVGVSKSGLLLPPTGSLDS